MDFEQVNQVAHEVEMWSTLAINIGILFSTVTAFWFLYALGKEPKLAQILAAAGLGFILTLGSLVGLGFVWALQMLVTGQPPSRFDYVAGTAVALFAIVGGAVYLAFLLRADRLKAKQN